MTPHLLARSRRLLQALRQPALIAVAIVALACSALQPHQASAQSASPAAPAASASAPSAAASAPDAAASAPAASPVPAPAPAALDERVQALKAEVIRLNRDLLILEEELLYPAGTQLAVFVSMDVGKLFELESVQIKVDDQLVATHLYTPGQVLALHRGGMQRLHLGNVKSGRHRIDAFFTGRGPHERDYKRGATLEFDKGAEPRYIELRIRDAMQRLQPEFDIKVW